MDQHSPSVDGRLDKRKAWTWIPPSAPPLSDLLGSATARRRWWKYWVSDMAFDALQWAGFHLFSLMPPAFVSACGALAARLVIRWRYPRTVQRTMENLRDLRPDWSEEQRRRAADLCFENEGRVIAEFAVLHKLVPSGRLVVEGVEHARAAAASGPVVVISPHTGNWETIGPAGAHIGLGAAAVFMPQPNRMQNYIMRKVRERCGIGSSLLPPGKSAIRPALRILDEGGHVLLLCDEAVGPVCVAPFFGGRPHAKGNLAIAVRLARRCDATIIPYYTTRHGGCRHSLTFLPPFKLPPTDDPAARFLEDVMLLNDVIEPIVRERLDQWYFLSWRNGALEERRAAAAAAPKPEVTAPS